MSRIYHIVPRSVWETVAGVSDPGYSGVSDPGYSSDSLAGEGFIHCSYQDQVARVANSVYRDQADLLVLCIDTERLSSPVRDEDPGIGQRFPHVYGPIDRAAVAEVRPLVRGTDGEWVFSG